jgi:hypothetical protein
VIVETAVFDGEYCLRDPCGNGGEGNRTALLAFAVDDRGQHRRVQHDAVTRHGIELEPLNPVGWSRRRRRPLRPAGRGPHRLLERHADHPAGQFGNAPADGDGGPADSELARLGRFGPFSVSKIIQPIDELALGERLTAPQFERSGEHARQDALTLAVQPLIDRGGEGDVVIADGKAQKDEWYRHHRCGDSHPATASDGGDA